MKYIDNKIKKWGIPLKNEKTFVNTESILLPSKEIKYYEVLGFKDKQEFFNNAILNKNL